MRRWKLIAVLLAVLMAFATLVAFDCHPGKYSTCNFGQVREGMKLEEVKALLGKPDVVIDESQLPSFVTGLPAPLSAVVQPSRVTPIDPGHTFYRWSNGSAEAIIGLKDGLVKGKWYWEPSL